MTNTTTAKKDNRRRNALLLSLLLHAVLILILGWSGVLDVSMVLDPEEAREKAEQVKEREKERSVAEKDRQAKERLSKEHARKAREEAERRRKQELVRRVQEMTQTRRQMLELKAKRLEQIQERSEEDYRERLAEQIARDAEYLDTATQERMRAPDRRGQEHQDASQAAKQTHKRSDELTQTPQSRDAAKQLAEAGREAKEKVQAAVRKEKQGDPLADKKAANHPMTKAAERIADRAEQLSDPSTDMKRLNDTSSARQSSEESTVDEQAQQNLAKMDAQSLYELAKQLEQSTEAHYRDVRAAELAKIQNIAFNEAQQKLSQSSGRPESDLSKALAQADALKTVGDLTEFRQALDEAVRQTRGREMRTSNMLDQALGRQAKQQGGGRDYNGPMAIGLGTGPSSGGGNGGSGGPHSDSVQQTGGALMENLDRFRRMGIDSRFVQAQALPGRKFTKSSPRQGWLYVDSWYVIGPWDNGGKIDYDNIHPPEYEIDFDAFYTDGKRGKSYTSRKGWTELDGSVRWRFTQSDAIRVLPYTQTSDATHYAYTELYFEEDTAMLVAVASDDATRVWINGELTWEELGLSSWSLGERFEPVVFRQGTNTVLIRLENGPGETLFSFLICPPDAFEGK